MMIVFVSKQLKYFVRAVFALSENSTRTHSKHRQQAKPAFRLCVHTLHAVACHQALSLHRQLSIGDILSYEFEYNLIGIKHNLHNTQNERICMFKSAFLYFSLVLNDINADKRQQHNIRIWEADQILFQHLSIILRIDQTE